MNNFMTLYIAEIRKIISRKAVWAAMGIGIAVIILLGMTNLSSEGHISYVQNSRAVLGQLEGNVIDDAFLRQFQDEVAKELAENPDRYEKLMEYDPGAAFMNGADAIGKKSLFDYIYSVVRNRSSVESVTAGEFYAKMRQNIIDDGRDLGSSDEEINIWLKEFDSIEKPIRYYYAQSYSNILDICFFVGWILFLNIAIALAGVFADEKIYRTDAIILSARKGRGLICGAKLTAGITVALVQMLSFITVLIGVMCAFFGTEGSAGMIQNIIPSSPWNITIAQMMQLLIILAAAATILFAVTGMLLSHITRSSVITMAVQAAVLFASLFNVPNNLGIITKLWQLKPTLALYYGTFCNTFRYAGMNNAEISVLLYITVSVIFCLIVIVTYQKSQVESR